MRGTFHAPDRAAWRAWLREHHRGETEVWLVWFKAHTGRGNVRYEEAVEEAICFGWIDGILKRLDADRHARRFSPRKNPRTWSALNVRRAEKMIREGRMTPAGLAVFSPPGTGEVSPAKRFPLEPPAFVEAALRASPPALDNFRSLPPYRRADVLGWILSAKREETRARRLGVAVERLKGGEPPGLK